jgi:hypothetical protein
MKRCECGPCVVILRATLLNVVAPLRGSTHLVSLAELLALGLVRDEEMDVEKVPVFEGTLGRGCPHHRQRQGRLGGKADEQE